MVERAEETRRQIEALESDAKSEIFCDGEDDDFISEFSDSECECDDAEGSRGRKRARRRKVLKQDLRGETELHKLCKREGNLDKIRKLISEIDSVDVLDNSNYSPLHEACNYGLVEYVRCLREFGADIDRVGGAPPDRVTPLITACCNGHLDVIEYLLSQGVKVNQQDNFGWSALDHLESLLKKSTDAEEGEKAQGEKLLAEMRLRIKRVSESGQKAFVMPKQKVSKALLAIRGEEEEEENQLGK